jgi:hypothetical protein
MQKIHGRTVWSRKQTTGEKKETAWNESNTGEENITTHPNTRTVHASH